MGESSRQLDRRTFLSGSVAELASNLAAVGYPLFLTCALSVHHV